MGRLMTDEEPKRTPANQNPWYVLMTLYGEQEGEDLDWNLHQRNCRAWNTWAGSTLTNEAWGDDAVRRMPVPARDAWDSFGIEIRRLHEAEMLRRNGPNFSYPGFPEPMRKEAIDFSNVDFSKCVWAEGLIFPADTRFDSAKFDDVAWFGPATFLGFANFVSTTFGGRAEFGSAVFCGTSSFSSATFIDNASFISATFIGNADFGTARFCADLDFVTAAFEGIARFANAIVEGSADVFSATFSGHAEFVSTTFNGVTIFVSASFGGGVEFLATTFSGFARFQDAEFGTAGEDHPVTFSDSQFLKPTNFRNAIFHSQYPDLSGAVLHDKTEFTARPENWPSSTAQPPDEAKASCARIRHAIAKQGLPEEEHFFYRREMGFACQIGGWWQRLPYRLFGLLSDFGASIARPVQALLLLWFWPAVFFFGQAQTGRLADYPQIGRALALSFANIFNFLGFHRTFFAPDYMQNLPAFLQVLSGFQTVAGVVLLFFLGLGLRTRFRLR